MKVITVLFLVAALLGCVSARHGDPLAKVVVRNAQSRLAVANDGTPAIFYYLKGRDPNLWSIYLEGGFWCINKVTCTARWNGARSLMSTDGAPDVFPGIWTNNNNDLANPFRDANMIYVPYVTSDSYFGNSSMEETGTQWQFRGRPVITAIIEDLFNGFTSDNVKIEANAKIILAGGSAGGHGVIVNSNYVGEMVRGFCATCNLWAVPDSGFYLGGIDYPLANASNCAVDVTKCPYGPNVQEGVAFWKSAPFFDAGCVAAMKAANKPDYYCAFTNNLVLYVREKQFLVENLFDAVELACDGCITNAASCLTSPFLVQYALLKRAELEKFPSFVTSCLSHMMSLDQKIGSTTLGEALWAWFNLGSKKAYEDKCYTPDCRSGCYGTHFRNKWLMRD